MRHRLQEHDTPDTRSRFAGSIPAWVPWVVMGAAVAVYFASRVVTSADIAAELNSVAWSTTFVALGLAAAVDYRKGRDPRYAIFLLCLVAGYRVIATFEPRSLGTFAVGVTMFVVYAAGALLYLRWIARAASNRGAVHALSAES